jgi:tryptophan-rich sensory protein
MSDGLRALVSVALCLAAGMLGSFFTRASVDTWYAGLAKPAFTPPGWVFAPVWTLLYVLMGIACYLVWRKGFGDPRVARALAAFGAQLLLNALWSPAFFGLRSCVAGLVVIVPLWGAIVLTIALFLPLSRPAALLLAPYLAWVSFAAVLNAALVVKN